jgi:predicted branched-subunit amino acid permease
MSAPTRVLAAASQPRPVRDGVGLGLAVGVSGVAFGAAAISAGLSVWQACALSLLAFTGASQFALAGVIAAGGSLLAGTAGAILLGSRNTLYGLRLSDVLRPRWPSRLLVALGVIDETTAVSLAQPNADAARTGFTATFCCLYLTWNLATLAGAMGAGRIGSPQSFGLDVVGPAAFLALIWPRLRAGRTERMVALAGAAIALGATPLLPVGVPVILAATAALAGALASPAARSGETSALPGSPGSSASPAGSASLASSPSPDSSPSLASSRLLEPSRSLRPSPSMALPPKITRPSRDMP